MRPAGPDPCLDLAGAARARSPGSARSRLVKAGLALVLLLLVGWAASACNGGSTDDRKGEARGWAPGPAREGEKHPIRISGSDDAYPLVRALARQFERDNADTHVVLGPPTHTRGGVAGVSLGDLDIGLISRPLTREERETMPTYLHLAEDIVVFATHPSVPIKRLTQGEILGIYGGRFTRWSEVGGPDSPIVVLDRAEHTSLKMVLRKQLFGASLGVTPNAVVLERPEDMLTSLGEIEGSIGYVSMSDAILAGLDIRFLAIDGVEPTSSNYRKGLYPFSRSLGLVVGRVPSKSAMRFVRFVYGDEGRRIIEAHGANPITIDLAIAVLPEQDLLAQEQRYRPLVEYLSQRLGLQTTVRLKLLPNYGEVIKEFREGGVNAGVLGSLALALARAQAGVEPLVRPEKDGVSQYRGLIVTRKDSGIQDWNDLKGKSFGFVDKATTAGYVFPLLYFREHGIENPEGYLGSIVYTGGHDLLFRKVYNRELDAGAAKDLMLEELAKTLPGIKAELRVLAASPPVPNNVFVLSGRMEFPCFRCHQLVPEAEPPGAAGDLPREPEDLKALLTRLFLGLHESPEGREVLEALGADRFVKTDLAELEEVNKILRQAGLDPNEYHPWESPAPGVGKTDR